MATDQAETRRPYLRALPNEAAMLVLKRFLENETEEVALELARELLIVCRLTVLDSVPAPGATRSITIPPEDQVALAVLHYVFALLGDARVGYVISILEEEFKESSPARMNIRILKADHEKPNRSPNHCGKQGE